MGPPLVAGGDHQLGVSPHEGDCHGDVGPVREDEVGVGVELLGDAEDVVPPAGVEATGVFPQLVEDLVHLKGGGDGFNKHGGPDRATGNAQGVLGVAENVVPKPSLIVVLQLGEVEVRAGAAVQGLTCSVEEDQAEVDEAGRRRSTVNLDMLLREVPTPRADDQGGRFVVQRVALAVAAQGEFSPDSITDVDQALHHVVPRGGAGVLEVGHEDFGPRVQGIDHHLAVGWTGDLDPPVQQVLGRGSNGPGSRTDLRRLGQEVRSEAGVELFLPDPPASQQLDSTVSEGPNQVGDEGRRLRSEHLIAPRVVTDFDAV